MEHQQQCFIVDPYPLSIVTNQETKERSNRNQIKSTMGKLARQKENFNLLSASYCTITHFAVRSTSRLSTTLTGRFWKDTIAIFQRGTMQPNN